MAGFNMNANLKSNFQLTKQIRKMIVSSNKSSRWMSDSTAGKQES